MRWSNLLRTTPPAPGRHLRRHRRSAPIASRILVAEAVLLGVLLATSACGGDAAADRPRPDSAGPRQEASQRSAASDGQAASTPVDLASLGFDVGNRDAPVRVVEMSDFGCGYCRKFQLETWPTLRREFVETGKVQWKIIPFVTGMFAHSEAASMAAECALEQSPSAFEALEQRLWRDQSSWKKSDDAAVLLRGWAAEDDLDMERYDSCVSERRPADRLEAGRDLARRLGVRGTPTFFILGYPPLPGALPTETFRKVLNAVYEDATSQGR